MGSRGKTFRQFLTGLFLLLAGASAALAGACRDDQIQLRGDWGQAQFNVDVADDEAERAQGLMHVEEMPRSAGMLFIYPRAGNVSFWMKNTLIPLDMIFADKTGTVRYVHHMAEPLSRQQIYGGNNIQYVLEINGGLAKAMNIVKGSVMRHPGIDVDEAAWPC